MSYYGPPQDQPPHSHGQQPYSQPNYPPQGQPYGQQLPMGPQQGDGMYVQQPYPPQPWNGQQPQGWQQPPPQWSTRHNWAGLTGLILGIFALLLDITLIFSVLGIWLSIPAAIVSAAGITKARLGTANNRGVAVTGVIVGLFALALGIVLRSWLNV